MTDAAASVQAPAPAPRIAPSLLAGLAVYAGYLAVFYATWAVNGVDYLRIGSTADSARLHYALPTLFGSVVVVLALTGLGWWRIALFDRTRQGPAWAWAGPALMLALALASLSRLRPEGLSAALVLWSVLGGIGVGFGEEMITRGALLVGLRSRCSEGRAWLWSTLAFSALHAPNGLFGLPWAMVPGQLLLTFIVGSLLYACRRLSGTLLLPIVLHGLWDSAVFLPAATGATPFLASFALYPVAIVCAVAVLRRGSAQPAQQPGR